MRRDPKSLRRIGDERTLGAQLQGDDLRAEAEAMVDDRIGLGEAGEGDHVVEACRQMSVRAITSRITARARSSGQSLRRRLVSNETRTPATRAISIAARLVARAESEIASEMPQKCGTRVAAIRAVAVKRFLLDLFEQVRSSVRSGGTQTREATVNDMLAAGADRVDKSFVAQPEIRDEVFQILAELYSDSFDPKQAIGLARRRLSAAQTAFGSQDARSAPAEVMLASVLLTSGEVPEATPLLAHAQTLLDRAGDSTSIERARLLRWQGLLVLTSGAKPPWHEHPLRRAAELLRERYPDDSELLATLVSLPSEACRYGETGEAIASADDLLRRTLARYGADNLFVDTASLLRGQLLLAGEHAGDAVPVPQQALEGFRRHVGEKNQNALAQLELSEAYWLVGRADESQRAFAAVEQAMARDHSGDKWVERMVAKTRQNLAKLQAGEALHRCGP